MAVVIVVLLVIVVIILMVVIVIVLETKLSLPGAFLNVLRTRGSSRDKGKSGGDKGKSG